MRKSVSAQHMMMMMIPFVMPGLTQQPSRINWDWAEGGGGGGVGGNGCPLG